LNLKLYNALTRKKESFLPLHKNWVGLYTCGPTVYNFAHIGNLRTYIFEDVLKKTLEYAGYKVRHIMNITDVDDKIIRDAAKTGKNIFEFVKPYEAAFFDDLKKLNIKEAWKYPKATGHIREMIVIVEELLGRGLAYRADGSVYFDISKFKSYGKLSRVGARELKAGARVDSDEYAKDNAQDFVLWKAAKEGEPSWDAPFGKGRPGWHIECSAMSMKYLSSTLDIHAGGVDLIFPHHENEIAQSEGSSGKPFARFFVEGEHLLVNGEKMSKSLGNVFTLRDIETRGFSPLAFRYLTLGADYRSKLNFTWQSLEAAQISLNRLYDFVRTLISVPAHSSRAKRSKILQVSSRGIKNAETRFKDAIYNDLHTEKALAVLWNFINNYNRNPVGYDSKEAIKLLYGFDRVLGLGLKKIKLDIIPKKILKLVKLREEYRKKKDWEMADEIREKLKRVGFELLDAPHGPEVRRL
jgi:cysteinyl-tRNA synthetase